MKAGCTGEIRAGILHLWLDTPGSSVNVFTPEIAAQLEQQLHRGLAHGPNAVVVRSGKPGSFVNGVGLLLAASSHTRAGAMDRADAIRRSYESLARARVPTIAAIEGNCYGCGLELALACDYRIARDSFDTHFYMPELRDYAFIPLFGATQRLPRLLGLKPAMDVLVGDRVDGRGALKMGLIDGLDAGGVTRSLPRFLQRLAAQGWPKRRLEPRQNGPWRRIGELPGPERPLAREALRLATLTRRRGYRFTQGLREELASFWKSLRTPESRQAMSFFFVRQGAKARAIGSAAYSRPAEIRVRIEEQTPALRNLARLLRSRPLPGVKLDRAADLAFAARKIPGVFTCVLGSRAGGADCAAWIPFPRQPLPLIELVPASPRRPWREGVALFQLLEQSGLVPVVTCARDEFVSHRFLAAFRAALGTGDDLLEFGFCLPAPLARERGRGSAVAAALAAEAVRALDERALDHPSQADVIASALFGFPATRGGLLRFAASGRGALARDAARVLGLAQP